MSAEFPDYDLYEELGLSPRASARLIEAAWRALAKEFHPDASVDLAVAEARMKRINAAHDVLADPTERARYDAWRSFVESEAESPQQGARSPQQPNRCPRCLKRYLTVAGLQWHRAQVEACR